MQAGFQIESPTGDQDFAVAVVLRDVPDIPKGIHFGYSEDSPDYGDT